MLTSADLAQLEAHGITRPEAERQLQLLRRPPAPMRLQRACTLGDGIVQLPASNHAALLATAAAVIDAGRVSKFVPASGAATRMFKGLVARDEADVARFFDRLDEFPFAAVLRQQAGIDGRIVDRDRDRVLHVLLNEMRYAELPKALIAFHRVGDTVRTAFEEQLLEGSQYTTSAQGESCTHFTVAPEFRSAFHRHLREATPRISQATGTERLTVTFSEQQPSTDTLAITPDGAPFREASGKLLLRPAGHGALVANLQALAGDIVVIKNIDNILPFERTQEVVKWKRLLIGYLATLEQSYDHARPLRVCGVVRNEGEPGGAPFWVTNGTSESAQIVESSQVDLNDQTQRRIFESSTHFNPVDIVCSLRQRDGRPFDLAQFVDANAVFLTRKSHDGRDLVALERPGLWNGAMAGWHTVFVEVPAETFAPVKTVFDLLRPQHQSL